MLELENRLLIKGLTSVNYNRPVNRRTATGSDSSLNAARLMATSTKLKNKYKICLHQRKQNIQKIISTHTITNS